MSYPARLLGADEHIVISLRPHWKTLIAPIVVFLATSAAATYLELIVPEGDWRPWLRLAIALTWLLIVLAWVVRPVLVWWFTRYTVTNKRLIIRTGVFSRSGRDVPLQRINDVSFERTWVERIIGSGTLHVESTSERAPIRLADIPHVEDVQRDLNEMAALEMRAGSTGPRPEDLPPPEQSALPPDDPGRPSGDERHESS